jgi:hypothetical protein
LLSTTVATRPPMPSIGVLLSTTVATRPPMTSIEVLF